MESFTVRRCALHIRDDGGDPNGVETHVLDVVQLAGHALPRSTAILPVCRVASGARAVWSSESVDHELGWQTAIVSIRCAFWDVVSPTVTYLVDGAVAPLLGGGSKDGCGE